MLDIKAWKKDKKGILIGEIKKRISGRKGYTCDHCERQYDDDICDACFAKMLVECFQETIEEKGNV